MAASGSSPRKFVEKIALQQQKEAEATAEFERVMKDVSRITQQNSMKPKTIHGIDDLRHTSSRQALVDRVHRSRQMQRHHRMSPSSPFDKRVDVSPYHLSPPDTSWRRANSDSAINRTGTVPSTDVEQYTGRTLSPPAPRRASVHGAPMESGEMETDNSLYTSASWEHRKPFQYISQQQQIRPRSCEVPGINIEYHSDHSQDTSPNQPSIPIGSNTGSLPDLTCLQFPSPLVNPIDVEDASSQQMLSPTSLYPLTGQMVTAQLSCLMNQRSHNASSVNHQQGSQHSPTQINHQHTGVIGASNAVPMMNHHHEDFTNFIYPQTTAMPMPRRGPQMTSPRMSLALNQPLSQSLPPQSWLPAGMTQQTFLQNMEQAMTQVAPHSLASSTSMSYRSPQSPENCQSPGPPSPATPHSPGGRGMSPSRSPGSPYMGSPASPYSEPYALNTKQMQQANALQHKLEQFNMDKTSPSSESAPNSPLPSTTMYSGMTGDNHQLPYTQPQSLSNGGMSTNVMHSQHQQPRNSIPDIVIDDLGKDIGSAMGLASGFDSEFFPQLEVDQLDLQIFSNDPEFNTEQTTEGSYQMEKYTD